MPMFSVVIPVYNVEKYLPKCVESVLGQSFSDFEIILVDDGSKDKSGEMCDSYARQDARVKVVHQKNQGLGCARNSGLRVASGDWILFLDSDDFWEKNALIEVAEKIDKFPGQEIYVCRWRKFCENKNTRAIENSEIIGLPRDEIIYFSSLEEEVMYYNAHCDWAVWKFVIKRTTIIGLSIFFLKNVRYGEDLYWVIKLFAQVRQLCFVNVLLYNYRLQENGTLSEITAENALRWLDSIFNTLMQCLSESLPEKDFILSLLADRYLGFLLIAAQNDQKRQWLQKIEQHLFVTNFFDLNVIYGTIKGRICHLLSKLPNAFFWQGCHAFSAVIYCKRKVTKLNIQ